MNRIMLESICGECGSPLREGASFCKVCGAPVQSADNTIICTECGKTIPSGSPVCPECGAPVQSAGSTIICTECGKTVPSGSPVCPGCGAPVQSAGSTIICTECGKAVPSGSQICPSCGAPTAPQAALMPAQPVADMPESGGLAVCAMVFSLLFPPIGLILGIIGRKKYRIPTNIALCKAAVIISVITCILYTVLLIKVVPELLDTYRTANEAKDKYNKVKEWIPFL